MTLPFNLFISFHSYIFFILFFFVSFSYKDITFVSVEPSVIASACVATALQGLDINRNRTTTTSQSSTDMTTKTNTMMMMMTPEQPISTTNYMITTTATNNSNSNNSRRHTTVQQANDQQNSTTIIPNNLYEQFLLAVEKQLGIDSVSIFFCCMKKNYFIFT